MPSRCDVQYMLKLTEKLIEKQLITSCLTCVNFNEGMEVCVIAQARPPIRVLVLGCPSWSEDLPF